MGTQRGYDWYFCLDVISNKILFIECAGKMREKQRAKPYMLEAAKELKVNMAWIVQIYNASEALPNMINPFFMLPLLGVLGVKARDLAGYSILQLIFHAPVVLLLVWLLAKTMPYVAPVFG